MKIAFNLLSVKTPYSGAAVYSFNLIKYLAEYNKTICQIEIYCQQTIKDKLAELKLYPSKKQNINFNFFGFKNISHRILFEQTVFTGHLKKKRIGILHSASNISPLNFPGIQILTLHDIIFKRFPARYGLVKKLYYSYFIRRSISKADKILVPTNATATDLKKYYACADSKISIIPYAHNTFLKTHIDDEPEILKKLNLPDKYFLFVGALEPGKNIDFLCNLMDKFIIKNNNYKLVIVGNPGWKYILPEKKYIHLLEKLNENELSAVYKNTALLLYPSLYEGVGMPVIEAQHFDIPVICSDYPAAFDITSKKNILPLNIDNWIERINEILTLKINCSHSENNGWSNYINSLFEIYSEEYTRR